MVLGVGNGVQLKFRGVLIERGSTVHTSMAILYSVYFISLHITYTHELIIVIYTHSLCV